MDVFFTILLFLLFLISLRFIKNALLVSFILTLALASFYYMFPIYFNIVVKSVLQNPPTHQHQLHTGSAPLAATEKSTFRPFLTLHESVTFDRPSKGRSGHWSQPSLNPTALSDSPTISVKLLGIIPMISSDSVQKKRENKKVQQTYNSESVKTREIPTDIHGNKGQCVQWAVDSYFNDCNSPMSYAAQNCARTCAEFLKGLITHPDCDQCTQAIGVPSWRCDNYVDFSTPYVCTDDPQQNKKHHHHTPKEEVKPVHCVTDMTQTEASCTADCGTVSAVVTTAAANGGAACADYTCMAGDGACSIPNSCDSSWMIQRLLGSVKNRTHLLHRQRDSRPYDELADYIITKRNISFHVLNITKLHSRLKRTLIIVDYRMWLFTKVFEYLVLPSKVRLVIIGNLYGSGGKFGDFSVRVGFRPKVFTKLSQWGGASPQDFKQIFDDERFVAFFVSQHAIIEHEKVISIPLGHNMQPKRLDSMWEAMFDAAINLKRRTKLLDNFSDREYSRARIIDYINSTRDFFGELKEHPKQSRIKDSLDTKFELNMPGDGIDSFHNMETLMLGIIPVMLTSTMDRSWEKLPVLIVDSYKMITRQVLKNAYRMFCERADEFEMQRLSIDYWMDLIRDVRDIGTTILDERHPLQRPSGSRYYNQNKTEMEKMWKYIAAEI